MASARVPIQRILSLCLLLICSISCATRTIPDNTTGPKTRIALEPCGFASYASKALCGRYEVFEDRASRAGRMISLEIVMLPALGPDAAPDPVFYLSGGPGQGAAKIASIGEDSLMTKLRRQRDLVFVDQRGTGDSHPLHCDVFHRGAAVQDFFAELFPLDQVRACRMSLARIADLRLYTTPIAMDDLDEVRQALGYEKINLYGISYGSMAAIQYLRQHPNHVRSLALAGVATPATKMPLHFAKGAQRAMYKLIHDCSVDDDCRSSFPDIERDLTRVLARLDQGPVSFDLSHPKTKEKQNVRLSRSVFAERIKNLLYNLQSASLMPLLLRRAAEGDWTPFGRIVTGTRINSNHLPAMGVYFTVTCSESVPFISDIEIAKETDGTFMGDYRTRAHKRACREWPRGEISQDYFAPLKTTAPVLMLSGELDGATPPQFAAAVGMTLINSRQILLRNTAHEYGSECTKNIIGQFISSGSVHGLDTTCISNLSRPPFAKELPARFTR